MSAQLELGIVRKDVLLAHPRREPAEHVVDGDAQPVHTLLATARTGFDGDAFVDLWHGEPRSLGVPAASSKRVLSRVHVIFPRGGVCKGRDDRDAGGVVIARRWTPGAIVHRIGRIGRNDADHHPGEAVVLRNAQRPNDWQ